MTRHQFRDDPRIPYTSHNSGACVAVEDVNDHCALEFAFEFVEERSADGSDPGVCVVDMASVSPAVTEFGVAATRLVLETPDALCLAEAEGIRLSALGGTGQGVIGALGSVGLRASGDRGRFIDLPGLRDLTGRVDAQALATLGITLKARGSPRQFLPGDPVETLDWVRPRLVNGKPVLPIEWSGQHDAWIPVDRKRTRSSQPAPGR